MHTFSAAPHHEVLVVLLQLAVLLFAARSFGELAQRLDQPSVVGEIVAGILLGPSVLSSAFPVIGHWIVPQEEVQGYLLELVSLIGAMFLLLITGLDTDVPLIRRHARVALGTAAGGLIFPFASGFLLGSGLPDAFLADPSQRLVFALFVATAMSISAIPVIAKVLIDLNLMRRDIGQTIIAAGMCDDTTGWVLLSIVAGLARGQAVSAVSVLQAVGRVAIFMLVSFTVGRWLVKRATDFVQDEIASSDRLLTLITVLMFAWAALTQALNLEAVLGAFIMGIIVGQLPRVPDEVHEKLHSIALGVFAPIFFAVAGLKVNVVHLFTPSLMSITLLVIFTATIGKMVGAYVGARLIGGRDHWTALAFGAGLNARGAMEIIVATIGLSLGILTQDMFSIIVVMAMATSLAAPPALRWILQRVRPDEEELKRLRQEELVAGSLVAGIHRVLLPVRARAAITGATQMIEARLLELMGRNTTLSITMLSVAPLGGSAAADTFLDTLVPLFTEQEVIKKVVEAPNAADVILDEAHKDYDLLILGAPEPDREPDALFTSMTDYLVRVSPCLTMVVQGGHCAPDWSPKRILVPTDGTVVAKHAAEIGFALAASASQDVMLLNVVARPNGYGRNRRIEAQLGIGYEIVQQLREHGESLGVHVRTDVRVGESAEAVILAVAEKNAVDLIILGTALRAGSERLFLGPGVERILKQAPCPVVVVNAL